MWTTNNGDRGTKSKPIPGPHEVYSFVKQTSPNAIVEPIMAMPVILTKKKERDILDARAMRTKRRLCRRASLAKMPQDVHARGRQRGSRGGGVSPMAFRP